MGLRIIHADDMEGVLENVEKFILAQIPDASIERVLDGQALVERVRLETYDLIITDNTMPELLGLYAIEQIRTFSKIPIYMLSSDRVKMRAFSVGATGYIHKDENVEERLKEILTTHTQ
jgi:two-component system chemotaxis response regulator CheY